jgi:hypothetical protein
LAGIGHIEGDFLKLPLRRTYDLYELWCYLRLIRAAALERGAEAEWREAFTEVSKGLVLAVAGKPFRFGAHTILFKPCYREVWRRDGGAVGVATAARLRRVPLVPGAWISRSARRVPSRIRPVPFTPSTGRPQSQAERTESGRGDRALMPAIV